MENVKGGAYLSIGCSRKNSCRRAHRKGYCNRAGVIRAPKGACTGTM